MAPSPPTRVAAASRGFLSARHWQDIRQAARIARSDEVTLVVHNVKISGGTGARHAAGSRQQTQAPERDGGRGAGDVQPMESDGDVSHGAKKKKQRDAARAQENRARKCIARWRTLMRRMHWARAQAVFVPWMRARLSPKRDARRRLRAVFWQAWTRPRFAVDDGDGSCSSAPPSRLGRLSHRDVYIRARAQRVETLARNNGYVRDGLSLQDDVAIMSIHAADAGLSAEEAEEKMIAVAIEESLAADTVPPTENRGGGHSPTRSTRDLYEAEIYTPASSRRRGKKTRGR